MGSSIFLAKLIGPVLVLRGLSILLDRKHFLAMLDGLEEEAKTISFSMIPVILMMAGIAVVTMHQDTSSIAGILILLTAWGMILKASLLILFPRLVVKKAQLLGKAGFIYFVCAMALTVGAYLCYVGYLA